MIITEKGVPQATILKPRNASDVVSFAATELRKYVHKVSGAELPVRYVQEKMDGAAIILNTAELDAPRDGLECDSFIIKQDGNRLQLMGNNDRAVLYAVYTFLESLGVAWLEPGEAGELLPQSPTIVIEKSDLAFKPAFDLRGYDIYGQGTAKQRNDMYDWMAKLRMNLLNHRSGVTAEIKKRGFIIEAGWHSWVDDRSKHAGSPGLGPDWDKDPANSRYIAMLDGKRQKPPGITASMTGKLRTQLCVSNREGVNKVIENAVKFIEARPWIDIYGHFPADSMNCWCECETCLRHSPTDLYINFANQLATRVRERWPRKKVMFIAYLDTLYPPRDVFPDESLGNMILFFCAIGRQYREPLVAGRDMNVTVNYPRNKAKSPGDIESAAALRAWRKTFNGPILLFGYSHWDYPRGRRRPGYLFFPSHNLITADMRYLKQLDITGCAPVQPPARWFPCGFDNYLYAKLLWDPAQDVGELECRYFEHFYGSTAKPAHECLTAMGNVLDTDRDDAESVRKLRQAADSFAAEMAVSEKTPLIAKRVGRIRIWAKYAILRKQYYCCEQGKDAQAAEKVGEELVRFLESNRHAIEPYQWVDILIPRAVLERTSDLKEEAGMIIEKKDRK